MNSTIVSPVVALPAVHSSHGRFLSKLTVPITVVVPSSVQDGFLLLHIARKCAQKCALIVVTKYIDKNESKHHMNLGVNYNSISI
jgi:hypothetical protein